jgi:uncharacterized phage protein gp47/JayE
MTIQINALGLEIDTLQEVIDDYSQELKNIYGSNIDLSQNTPDGQRVGIEAKARHDLQQALLDLKNNFDPDLAQGAFLDILIKFAGIVRQAATRSQVDVNVTTDRNLTLQTGYTLRDDIGQNWVLTQNVSVTTGTTLVTFFAKEFGDVKAAANTITQQETIVVGVTNVNNPNPATPGRDEETDKQLRIRRRQSTEAPALTLIGALKAALGDIQGVKKAKIFENATDTDDPTLNLEAHFIWVIVQGGQVADIAEVIAKQRSAGVGMKGSIVTTYQESLTFGGNDITIDHQVKFDRPVDKEIYVDLKVSKTKTTSIDTQAIKDALADRSFDINEDLNVTSLYSDIYSAGDNFVAFDLKASRDNITFTDQTLSAGFDEIFSIPNNQVSISVV